MIKKSILLIVISLAGLATFKGYEFYKDIKYYAQATHDVRAEAKQLTATSFNKIKEKFNEIKISTPLNEIKKCISIEQPINSEEIRNIIDLTVNSLNKAKKTLTLKTICFRNYILKAETIESAIKRNDILNNASGTSFTKEEIQTIFLLKTK